MALKILLVFATPSEAEIMKLIPGLINDRNRYNFRGSEIEVIITGIGGISTAWSMKQWLCNNAYPDLAINAGIAGSYNDIFKKGDVVVPVSDCFADLAIEDGKKFLTLAEAGLTDPDRFPFEKGFIRADNRYVRESARILRTVRAITVNTASGTKSTIDRLKIKFNPDIETMEGATFFYICSMEKVPFLGIRAISNRVGPRNLKSWDIPHALINLAAEINNLLNILT